MEYRGMKAPRYKITLTQEERGQLEELTRSGKTAAAKFIHARALLLCDAGAFGNPWKVADVAAALGIALACSPAPAGRVRWTVRLRRKRWLNSRSTRRFRP
jgi:hypothetical protein